MSSTPLRDLVLTLTMSAGSGPTVPLEDDRGINMGEVLLARYGFGFVAWMRANGQYGGAYDLERELSDEGYERAEAKS